MPARLHPLHPGFGFAAMHGYWPMAIRCDDGLYLGWCWIVDRACALELPSRNHPSSPAECEIRASACLIWPLTKVEHVEQERQKYIAQEKDHSHHSNIQRRQRQGVTAC